MTRTYGIKNVIPKLPFDETESFRFTLKAYDTIDLYCYDREQCLIEGLVHELTEATITNILRRKYQIPSRWLFSEDGYAMSPEHLATVFSMEYYQYQKPYIDKYESFLKRRK